MKPSQLKHYEKFSPGGTWVFLKDALFAGSKLRRLSGMNRMKDYAALAGNAPLLELHRKLHQICLDAETGWESYDYGEGYFYQSYRAIHLSGLRDTEARVTAMNLCEAVKGKTVLEIGCNTGFLALSLADVCTRAVGFDLNPYLIRIAREVAEFRKAGNVEFSVSSFEDFKCDEKFGAVLSFANHSTYDGNTRQALPDYFDRCAALLQPGGLFLFESHPPALEGDGLDRIVEMIGERFEIHERRVLEYGTFLDRGRTFIRAQLR